MGCGRVCLGAVSVKHSVHTQERVGLLAVRSTAGYVPSGPSRERAGLPLGLAGVGPHLSLGDSITS